MKKILRLRNVYFLFLVKKTETLTKSLQGVNPDYLESRCYDKACFIITTKQPHWSCQYIGTNQEKERERRKKERGGRKEGKKEG